MSKMKLDTINTKAPKDANKLAFRHELEKLREELLV